MNTPKPKPPVKGAFVLDQRFGGRGALRGAVSKAAGNKRADQLLHKFD